MPELKKPNPTLLEQLLAGQTGDPVPQEVFDRIVGQHRDISPAEEARIQTRLAAVLARFKSEGLKAEMFVLTEKRCLRYEAGWFHTKCLLRLNEDALQGMQREVNEKRRSLEKSLDEADAAISANAPGTHRHEMAHSVKRAADAKLYIVKQHQQLIHQLLLQEKLDGAAFIDSFSREFDLTNALRAENQRLRALLSEFEISDGLELAAPAVEMPPQASKALPALNISEESGPMLSSFWKAAKVIGFSQALEQAKSAGLMTYGHLCVALTQQVREMVEEKREADYYEQLALQAEVDGLEEDLWAVVKEAEGLGIRLGAAA